MNAAQSSAPAVRRPFEEQFCQDVSDMRKRITDNLILDCADELTAYLLRIQKFRMYPGFPDTLHTLECDSFSPLSGARILYWDAAPYHVLSSPINFAYTTTNGPRENHGIRVIRQQKRIGSDPYAFTVWLTSDRPGKTPKATMTWSHNGKWTLRGIGHSSGYGQGSFASEVGQACQMALAYLATCDRFWSFDARMPGSHYWLRIPIDRYLAYRLFRHREKPVAKTRREALRHTVSEHWRTLETFSEDAAFQTFVRLHLRGEEVFEWFDLECRLRASVKEQRAVQAATVAREAMRPNDKRVVAIAS